MTVLPRRLSAYASGLLLALTVTGCAFSPTPTPNPGLVVLWNAAHTDAQRLNAQGDQQLRQLRTTQAQQLQQEALRECGHDTQGHYPDSCDVAHSAAAAGGQVDAGPVDLGRSAEDMLTQLVATSPEAAVLVGTQYGQLVHAAQLIRPTIDLRGGLSSPEDQHLATHAAQEEYAAAYAISLAGVYLPQEKWWPVWQQHLRAARGIEQALTAAGVLQEPLAAPGYRFTAEPAPRSAAEAQDMLARVQVTTQKMWLHTLGQAEGGPLRRYAAVAASYGPYA